MTSQIKEKNMEDNSVLRESGTWRNKGRRGLFQWDYLSPVFFFCDHLDTADIQLRQNTSRCVLNRGQTEINMHPLLMDGPKIWGNWEADRGSGPNGACIRSGHVEFGINKWTTITMKRGKVVSNREGIQQPDGSSIIETALGKRPHR